MASFRLLAALGALVLLCAALAAQTETKKKPAPDAPAAKSPATKAPAAVKPAGAAPARKAELPPEEPIPPAAPDALFPAVVAKVNGRAVLGRDLEQRIEAQLAPMGNPKWTNLREEFREELTATTLRDLVGSELVYQKAYLSGVRATEAEVKDEFTRFAKTFASDAELNLALANRGLDRAGLNRELEKSLVVSKYVADNILKKLTVSPAEAAKYYQDNQEQFRHPDLVRTSHILFRVGEGATAEQERKVRQQAEAVLARVRKGEDFAKLAREYSTDSSASQGGDIGPAPSGQLAPEYEEAAWALPVGGTSALVRTQFGFHIIKVTEKQKAGVFSLEQVQQQLTAALKESKAQVELNKLVAELAKEAKIESLIPASAVTASSPRP